MPRKLGSASIGIQYIKQQKKDMSIAPLSPDEGTVLYGMIVHGQRHDTEKSSVSDIAKTLFDSKITLPTRAVQKALDRLCHWRPAGYSPSVDDPSGPVRKSRAQVVKSRDYHLDQSKMVTRHIDALLCVEAVRMCQTHAIPRTTLSEGCVKSLRVAPSQVEESIVRLLQKRYLMSLNEAAPLIVPTYRVDEEISLIMLLACKKVLDL